MKHTQNASDVQCSSQKTQTIGEGKNAAENDVQSCSQLKRGIEPAFPMGYHPEGNSADHSGMTLRDYFAAAALQGMLADPQREGLADDYAKHAYLCADAMIKAREEK